MSWPRLAGFCLPSLKSASVLRSNTPVATGTQRDDRTVEAAPGQNSHKKDYRIARGGSIETPASLRLSKRNFNQTQNESKKQMTMTFINYLRSTLQGDDILCSIKEGLEIAGEMVLEINGDHTDEDNFNSIEATEEHALGAIIDLAMLRHNYDKARINARLTEIEAASLSGPAIQNELEVEALKLNTILSVMKKPHRVRLERDATTAEYGVEEYQRAAEKKARQAAKSPPA